VYPPYQQILDICLRLLTHDPNYNYSDYNEDEGEMDMDDDDDDADEDDDEYRLVWVILSNDVLIHHKLVFCHKINSMILSTLNIF